MTAYAPRTHRIGDIDDLQAPTSIPWGLNQDEGVLARDGDRLG